MSRSTLWILAAGTAVVGGLLAPTGRAQAQDEQRRIERAIRSGIAPEEYRTRTDTSLQLLERTQLDVGGFVGWTGVWLNDSTQNSRRLSQPEVTLYARATLDGAHTFFGRSRFVYRDFSPGDSFDGRGDRWVEPFPDRYWYEFDLRRAAEAYAGEPTEWNVNVRIGRQFVDWGAGLTLSETLYAVRPTLELGRRARIEGLAGITPDHTTDFDASRFTYDEKTRRAYFGLRAAITTRDADEWYVFVLDMRDYYNDNRTRTTPVLDGINFRYDATYVGLGSQGALGRDWAYQAEVVWQTGQSQADPFRLGFSAQTTESINAWAGRAGVAYVFRDAHQSRATAEFLWFSGDVDRNISTDTVGGNLLNTTDRGFNSLGFAPLGLAFAPSMSNLMVLRTGLSTFPLADVETFRLLQVGVDAVLFSKFERRGPIDEPTSAKYFLGTEFDLYANWRITSDLSLALRYGLFLPGAAITSGKNARHFFLVSFSLAF